MFIFLGCNKQAAVCSVAMEIYKFTMELKSHQANAQKKGGGTKQTRTRFGSHSLPLGRGGVTHGVMTRTMGDQGKNEFEEG